MGVVYKTIVELEEKEQISNSDLLMIGNEGTGELKRITYENATKNVLADAKEYTDTKTTELASSSDVTNAISTHNISTEAHNDIRDLISGLTTRLNALADSDDTTLDQMSEVVAYIKSNKSLIESIITAKVSVEDIIDNLTTNISNKPLSAAQGVVLKGFIDTLQTAVDGKANASALTSHTDDANVHMSSTEKANLSTAYTHSQTSHAPSNAQANVIESIKVNGTAQTISDKSVDITVPTKASDIGAATKAELDSVSNEVDVLNDRFDVQDEHPDTLTWDGNTEGLDYIIEPGVNCTYYRVSDVVLSDDDVYNISSFSLSDGTIITKESVGEQFVLKVADCVYCFTEFALYIVTKDYSEPSAFESNMNVIKPGVYFIKDGDIYISSLTINGYTGFKFIKLKEEYLPETKWEYIKNKPFDSISISEVTYTWDGNTEGKELMEDGSLVKISSDVPEYVLSGKRYGYKIGAYSNGEISYSDALLERQGDLLYLLPCEEDGTINPDTLSIPFCMFLVIENEAKGVWFADYRSNLGMYTTSLTCPAAEINTIHEDAIPDTIARKSDLENIDLSGIESQLAGKANTSDLTSHTGNKSNPHGVTASQVGALSTSGGTISGGLAVSDKMTQGNPSEHDSVKSMNRFHTDLFIQGDGSAPNNPNVAGFYLGKSESDENRHLDIVSGADYSYIDFNKASSGNDFTARILVNVTDGSTVFNWGDNATNRVFNVLGTLQQHGMQVALQTDIPTKTQKWTFTLEDGTVVEEEVYVK